MMAKLAGGGAPTPQGAPNPAAGPKPSGAPMAKPQEKEGMKEAARVNIHIAMNMLEQALPVFGSESKEGKSVLKILGMLSKEFGESDASDLVPAEILQMNKSLPQAGGGTEVQRMLQKMQQGGGAPPGAQPGMPPQGMAA
jgi:hypothetical protein